MNSPETCPIGNREFFLVTVVLIGVTAIFPPIAWVTGFLAIFVVGGWLLYDAHGFLSAFWRIFLFGLLAFSILLICVYQNYNQSMVIMGSVGILAASSGLVRSFFFKKA
jgi:hypothetical protein